MDDKKTPLYDRHVALGGKIVSFGGYLLPVEYKTGVIAEHMAVRTAAGLFDVSHMGEVIYEGRDALSDLNYLLTNDFTDMPVGRARYSPMCNREGGIVDDLIVYKSGEEKYLVIVNASNRFKDVAWMKENLFGNVQFKDVSDNFAQIALQGPRSLEIISSLVPEDDIPQKYYTFKESVEINGMKVLLSRTGYTGEQGFEIYCTPKDAPELWTLLLDKGKDFGLIPCGLGARDTLRLEAAMPLYGHEMTDEISPLETGLSFAVKFSKQDFIGREALINRGESKVCRVGLKAVGRGIVREHCDIYDGDEKVGFTTSGTFCPFLGYAAAMAIVPKSLSETGTRLFADVRGRRIEIEVVKLPFYSAVK